MNGKKQTAAVSVLLAGILFTAVNTAAQKERMELVRAITPSVVALYTYDADGKLLAQGSGFFTGRNGDFITASHLLRGAASGEVVTAEGEVLGINGILAEDSWSDLVRLTTATPPSRRRAPLVRFSRPQSGEKVLVVGGALVTEHSLLHAAVQAVREVPYTGEIFRLTDWAPAGAMGGPVINLRGEVVGIIAHPVATRNGNLAVSAEALGRLAPQDRRSLASVDRGTEGTSEGGDLRRGLSALWEGDYREALTHFLDAVTSDPSDTDAAFLTGYCLNRIGLHHSATRILRQVVRVRESDVEARHQLGLAYSKLGCFQDAAEQYREIVAVAPDDIDARYKLSYAYSRLDWHNEAAETFAGIVALVCKSGLPGEESCADMAGSRTLEMIETYRRYIWTDNGEADIHYQRGLAYLALARTDLAMQEYRSLKKRNAYQAARLYRLVRK